MKRILLMVYLFAVAVSYGQQTSAKANGVNNPIVYNQQQLTNAVVTPSTSQSDLKAQGVDKPVFYNPQKRATASLQQTASINGATSVLKLQGGNNPLFNSQDFASKPVASTTSDFSSRPLSALDLTYIKNGIAPLEKSLFGTYGFIPSNVEGKTSTDPSTGSTSSLGGGPCGVPVLEVNQSQENTCMINIAQGRFSQSYIAQEPYSAGAGIKFRIPPSIGLSLNLSLWDGIPNHGGTKIASGTNLTDGTIWTDVFWDSVVSVSVGNTYFIDVTGDVSLPCISGSTSDPYPGGLLYLGASPWPNHDLVFRTFSCDNSGTGGGGTGNSCNQKNPSNNFENAFETSKSHGIVIATDLQVSNRTNFILEKITVNIWMEPGETLTSADISFYNHDSVNLQPGSFRNTQLSVVPVSQTVIGNKDGYDVSEVTFEITPELLSGKTGATTYWVSIYADVSRNGIGLIEVTSENIIESTSAVSDDGGQYWNRKIGWDTIYVFEGKCETIDTNICIEYNPSNHYENGFSVSKNKQQMIATDFNVDAYTDFTMEKITVNIWVNPGEILTSADISFYDHDMGSDFPGALRNIHTGVVPFSQRVIGFKDGYDVFEVVFDITPETMPGSIGASTKYWVSIFADISSDELGLIEATSESIADKEMAYSYDGGATWKAMEGWDTVYIFEGSCENMDGNLCGEVNPANNFQDAFTTSKNQDQLIATDITVPADQDFNLEKITVLIWMAPYDWLTSADITFYENDGDLPGAVRKTLPGVVPVSRTVISEDVYENYVYEVVFEIDPVLLPGIAGAKNTYWVSLFLDIQFDSGFIESTTASIKGVSHAYSSDRGATWGVNEGWDTVYTFEGICGDLGSGGGSGDPCSAIGLSNNFEDRMRFSKEDESILAADITIAADHNMILETINFRAFIGDAGSGDNANYADVFIYEDSGTGSPGALLTSQTNVVPFRQTFIADAGGMQVWSVDLNIADVNLPGKLGEETTYWIGLSVEGRNRGNNHWEISSAGVNGYGVAYAYDGNDFEVNPNYEVVYKFAGSCSPINPDYCSVSGLSNNFEDRMRFATEDESILAADITIAADEDMLLESINFIAFIGDAGSGDNANYADVFIYEDSGTGSPGALLTSQTNVVPVRQTFIRDIDGMQVWSIDLNIADVNLAGKSGEETTYWIGLSVQGSHRGNCHWEISRAGAVGHGLAFAYDGNDFEVDPTMEAVYTFKGSCGPMNPIPDMCGGTGRSNGFEDLISFSKNGGNIVAADVTILADEDMVLETINFTAFINGIGSGTKVQHVDVFIYEDSGTGSPGTLLTSQTEVVPVLQTVIGEIPSGYQAWSVDLDIAHVTLSGTEGVPTTYWIGLSVRDEDGGNNFWETSSAGVNGFGLAYDHGGGFIVDPTMEVVYTFAGSCSPMDPSVDLCGGTAPSNNFENGKSFTKNLNRITVNDLTINEDEDMLLQTINFNAFIGGVGSGVNASNVDVFIYEDSGTGSPGALIASQTNVIPVSQTLIGQNFGFQAWDVELDIMDIVLRGQAGVETTYWIGLSLDATDGSNTFWEFSSAEVIGYGLGYNDGTGFVMEPTNEGVYTFAGSCGPMDPSGDSCDITGTSNNLEDGKSFTKNLGRIVANDITIAADQDMLLESITISAFIGGAGSGVNASNVDVFIYSDSGTGSPGALLTSQLNVVPASQSVIGSNFGFNLWSVDLDITDVNLFGQLGVTTTYWIGISLEPTDGSNTFWEYSSSGVIGYGLGYNDGAGFVMEPTNEGVYTFSGTCSATTGGPLNDNCSGAIALSCGDSVTGDTSIATDSGGNPASDVYYKYTGSGTAQLVTISLCGGGTDYDSVLRVFDNCDLSNEIAMNDDFCGLQSELSFESDGTSTYYIMVEGSGSDSGNFGLDITCESLSVTDNPFEGFSYYPNPTNGVLNLSSKNNIEMVTIYNLLGQTVLTQKVGAKSATLDISRLSIATYIMRTTVNGQVGVYKIVKK